MSCSVDAYTTDINVMLHDVSNQMARAQLFRRLSAKSNHSSPGSTRGNTRVVKPHSSGGTPLGVQRRRTTAAHSIRSKPPTAQPLHQFPQAAKAAVPRSRQDGLPSTTRPVTWHPGSYCLNNYSQEIPYNGDLPYYRTGTLQEPYFNDFSDCAVQPSSKMIQAWEAQEQDILVNDYIQQSMPQSSQGVVNGDASHPSTIYEHTTQFLQQDPSLASGYGFFPSNIQTEEPILKPSDHMAYSMQHTPISSSNQYACDPPQYLKPPNPPQVTKQRSKELVGMGLYDGPSRKDLSAPATSVDRISQLLAAPQGKGLKLEETWQPPNEEVDDDEEDEGSSTDEAEEDLPPAPTQAETQPTFYPSYGDLSNQSFLFDSDDPYVSCMSFNQGMQVFPQKASEPPFQDFMWF